jgi:release factor glutamine methyltransferase
MMKNRIALKLKKAGVENYLFEAKIIEEHAEKNNLDIYALADRRIKREPLQYILGEWEFYGDVYKLNKDCLIPRPETEFLTEYIISNAKKGAVVLDLCSGSGCVSISALKRREDLRAVLVDISSGAVNISRENAVMNKAFDRIDFYCLDIIKDAGKIMRVCAPDLVVSNPPYLTINEVNRLKSEKTELSHEPEAAFCGGIDGLNFYKFIINNYTNICSEIIFECGINQYKKITEMFKPHNFNCTIIKDYNKIERVIIGKKN